MRSKVFSKVVLVIIDGFGIASPSAGNAVSLANPSFFTYAINHYPVKVLQASGPTVGLPWGEKGNSEVGHLTIGAGRVVTQELLRIDESITNGSFFEKDALLKAINTAKQNNSTLHLIGMIGDAGVHAHEQHLYTLLGFATDQGVKDIKIHVFTDGRDSGPKDGLVAIQRLQSKIKENKNGQIATITGRFYAMDRGGHWEQTQSTVQAIVKGEGEFYDDPEKAITDRYNHSIYDEMIPPTVIVGPDKVPVGKVNRGDAAIFFNYRNDRMIQLVRVFLQETEDVFAASMTLYDPTLLAEPIFLPEEVSNTLGECISNMGWRQFRAAETEKFAHVTFFFNGQRHDPWPKEDREIVKSPIGNANNYEDTPEMSARQLTDMVIKRIETSNDRFVLMNFANPDMVGHTGNISATEKAILTVDECLQKIAGACEKMGALLLITADHGNCEVMLNPKTGEREKEHSLSPVPFLIVAPEFKSPQGNGVNLYTLATIPPGGILCDIAPTVLDYLGVPKPDAMTGTSLAV